MFHLIRWEKLSIDYKKVQDNNRKTVQNEYEEEICEIVRDDPVYNDIYSSAKPIEQMLRDDKKKLMKVRKEAAL